MKKIFLVLIPVFLLLIFTFGCKEDTPLEPALTNLRVSSTYFDSYSESPVTSSNAWCMIDFSKSQQSVNIVVELVRGGDVVVSETQTIGGVAWTGTKTYGWVNLLNNTKYFVYVKKEGTTLMSQSFTTSY